MAEITFTAYGAYTQVVTDQEPANDGLVVSDEIDNSTSLDLYADLECRVQFGTTPTLGGYITCYLVPSIDGVTYTDGADGSTVPPATAWVCNFPVRLVTAAQRIAARGIRITPGKFRFVLQNKAGQTVSTDSLQLYYRAYGEMVE